MRTFCMLLVNNNRSKAYLQCLLSERLFPEHVLLLDNQGRRLAEHTLNDIITMNQTKQSFLRFCPITGLCFDEKESVTSTLVKSNISFDVLSTIDPNNDEVVDAVKRLPADDCIYSGAGGTILKQNIFRTGKRLIHAHPGIVPKYRGSTTIYYSLLLENKIGVTLMSMNEKLDEGDVLLQKEYDYVTGGDLDYVIDPCVRAHTLIEWLKTDGESCSQTNDGNVFYIIHPLLKHLAILKSHRVDKRSTAC